MSKKAICIVSPLTELSGNLATASRIASYFQDCECLICGESDSLPTKEFDLCFLIHALRAGRMVWPNVADVAVLRSRKYVLIFGGTDVNVFSQNADDSREMTHVIRKVNCVVSFSASLAAAARHVFGDIFNSEVVIRQAFRIASDLSSIPSGQALDNVLSQLGRPATARIALFAGGVRHVKGHHFAVEAWKGVANDIVLICVGSCLDAEYLGGLRQFATPNVLWYPGVPTHVLHSVMIDPRIVCVLNTSESEGQPQTIIEAMFLMKACVVRDIPANLDVIDRSRGFTVHTPEDLAALMNGWAEPPVAMLEAARAFVSAHHSEEGEKSKYRQFLDSV